MYNRRRYGDYRVGGDLHHRHDGGCFYRLWVRWRHQGFVRRPHISCPCTLTDVRGRLPCRCVPIGRVRRVHACGRHLCHCYIRGHDGRVHACRGHLCGHRGNHGGGYCCGVPGGEVKTWVQRSDGASKHYCCRSCFGVCTRENNVMTVKLISGLNCACQLDGYDIAGDWPDGGVGPRGAKGRNGTIIFASQLNTHITHAHNHYHPQPICIFQPSNILSLRNVFYPPTRP
jgi:hypothetical protein